MKIAVLTSVYPAVSHTFIRSEVVALRELGVEVETFSIWPAHGVGVLGPVDMTEVRSTRYVLARGRLSLARELQRAFVANPRAVLSVAFEAVRSVRGMRRRLWQLFYAGEAAILHPWVAGSGITHVHAHFGNSPADVARWTAALGNRISGGWTWSFTMHGPSEFYAVDESGLREKLPHADFVACISDFCRSQLMVFSDPSIWPKLKVIHCGVIPADFGEPRNTDDGVLTIVCLGRLVPEKGQTVLLRAMHRLGGMGIAARVVFVGDGSSRAALEAEASSSAIDASFRGSVSHDAVPALLSEADVFCLPSFAEGLPIVLMEAMASGLPVVTTRIAGIQELVDDGVSGFVVAPGRDDLLAAALAELARNPELARSMGAAGRAKVREEFDVADSARALTREFAALGLGSPADDPEIAAPVEDAMSPPIAVAICTYDRPRLLDRLIATVIAIAQAEFPGEAVPIVVVDDSPRGSARPVVESAANGGNTLQYVHTASGDISSARNAAVATASELASFVACVDDDCVPQPGWLAELFRVANESDAAIVAGQHRYVADDDAPRWLREQPFLLEHAEYEDGSVPPVGNMSSVLIRSSWFRSNDVRFRRDLGRLGGEDMVFFADARASGAEIRFSARSLVLEPRDARRSTFRYQLWRQVWLGNNEAHISVRTHDYGRFHLAARGARRVLRGVGWPMLSLRERGRPQLRWAFALIASGLGLLAGVVGVEVAHRS